MKLPENFYSTQFYTDKAIEYIDKVRADDKPFFGYVTYTAPHWPLQVPEKYSGKYRGKYDAGYTTISENRLAKMKKAGVVSAPAKANPGSACYADWDSLSPEERRHQARLMEIYAGMVDALDENIGRLLTHLEEKGELDNTLVMFISDNGADARPAAGLGDEADYVARNFDNSFENWGAASSFVSYGGAWAQVGSTPFKLHKGVPTEGGIRAPAIIHFPGQKLKTGVRHQFGSVMDILPTFLEVAGVEHPGLRYQGRKVLPVVGESMLSYLIGRTETVHDVPLYGFSIHRRQGLQQGKWKIVKLPEPYGDAAWELYDLTADPGETRNLASKYPQTLEQMTKSWKRFAEETGVVVTEAGSRIPGECATL